MNNCLIQYLRKNDLAPSYMGEYLNLVLRSIINNSHKSFTLFIWGGCWSRNEETSETLVTRVFDKVDLSNTNIFLVDRYKCFSSEFTKEAIDYNFVTNGVKSLDYGSDHSKVVALLCEGKVIFL